jgi:hypothetical protein
MTGAVLRAVLVVLLVVMPSMAMPGISDDAIQIVTLVAIFAAALVIFEYGSVYPGIVEFRAAPPYNRIRYVTLLVIVFALTMVARHEIQPNDVSRVIVTAGVALADLLDFPYSPVRMAALMLPETAAPALAERFRISAAIAYTVSISSLVVFAYFVQFRRWPLNAGPFNVWINLPTFDPTRGEDVVSRLTRDGRVNIALGVVMPFLVPAAVRAAAAVLGTVEVENPLTMIWVAAAWAFLPTSLLMRGIALSRIASLIAMRRRRAPQPVAGFQPAV